MSTTTPYIPSEFEHIHDLITLHRARASMAVNHENLFTAWEVGAFVSSRLKTAAWGSKTVTQLSEYLRAQDPALRGYGRSNIYNMVALYDSYSSPEFLAYQKKFKLAKLAQPATARPATDALARADALPIVQIESGQFPGFLNLTTLSNHFEILNTCDTLEERIFYALYSRKEHLNIKELRRCIKNQTFAALIGDKRNFSKGLKTVYPQTVTMFKDTVFLDFLGLPKKHSEKRLQHGILDNLKNFILELGKDFLFVDKEFRLQVGTAEFKVDLLFFHRGLQCLVAVELKSGKFKPEHMGQLEFNLEALDRDVRRSNENPSIGILLCQDADHSVVEYAMSRSLSPTMVAEYKRLLIPKKILQRSLEEFAVFFKASTL